MFQFQSSFITIMTSIPLPLVGSKACENYAYTLGEQQVIKEFKNEYET